MTRIFIIRQILLQTGHDHPHKREAIDEQSRA